MFQDKTEDESSISIKDEIDKLARKPIRRSRE